MRQKPSGTKPPNPGKKGAGPSACYIWYRSPTTCRVFRLRPDPIMFPDVAAVVQHLANHTGLQNATAVILSPGQDGGLGPVKAMEQFAGGGHFVIRPKGTRNEIATPDFFKSRDDVARVNYLFGMWDRLVDQLATFIEEATKRPQDLTGRQGKKEWPGVMILFDDHGALLPDCEKYTGDLPANMGG
jgi:hypothetical protein